MFFETEVALKLVIEELTELVIFYKYAVSHNPGA
jgi:hypothetical protein